MKDLLYKILFGTSKESLTKQELKKIDELERLGLISSSSHKITFANNVTLGKVDIPSSHPKKRRKIAFVVPIKKSKERDFIANESDLRGAKNGDLVIFKPFGRDKGRLKAKVLYTEKVQQPDRVGVVLDSGGKKIIKEFFSLKEIHTTSKQKALRALPKNCVVAIDEGTKVISDVLGVLDDPSVDELVVLRRYNREEEFSKEAVLEAKSYGGSVDKSMYPTRVDLTHLDFITIDPKSAKDFDDAIYYDTDKKELFVAIADVTEYVTEFSALDKEAKRRGFSIYFPHKSIPMLPRVLSENLCSLNEKVDRLVFAFKISLDARGNVIRYELFEGIINSKRRFCYEEIDAIYENEKLSNAKNNFIPPFLLPLRNMIQTIRARRLTKGYQFHTPDIRLELDEDLELVRCEKEEDSFSHHLVEECMLLANICASQYFKYGIFRTHPAPERRGIQTLIHDLASTGIYVDEVLDMHKQVALIQAEADKKNIREIVDKMIIKSLKRAEYSYENIGHFGLGFESYSHFTSPIRRYSDLILHRYLKAIIHSERKKENFINKELVFTTKIVTSLEGETSKIMWDYEDFVYARWGEKNTQKIFTGFIQDVGEPSKDTIVKLKEDALGARIFCKFDKNLRLENFQDVKVKVISASLLSARIYGEILIDV